MDAIESIARKRQVVGEGDHKKVVGRKTKLRPAEEERLRRIPPFRRAFNRLKRSPSNASTAMQIHGILKGVRGKMESAEGLEVKMKSGRRYKLTESTDVRKGRLGMKQAARGAVWEEVEEVQEQQQERIEHQQEKEKEGELSAGEKRRQEAKERQSEWRKGEFGSTEENVHQGATAQTSALSGTTRVSVGESHEDHVVSLNDDESDDADSGDGPQDMPIA